MIERVRSVNKIVLVALTLVFAVIVSLGVSSMLAPSAWAERGKLDGGAGSSLGKGSRDKWVLGDAPADHTNDVIDVFINGHGTQGCSIKYKVGEDQNDPKNCGDSPGLGDAWPGIYTEAKENYVLIDNVGNVPAPDKRTESRLQAAISDGITRCKQKANEQGKGATCDRPRVVAVGSVQYTGKGCPSGGWCQDRHTGRLTHSIIGTFGSDRTLTVNGNTVTLNQSLAGSDSIEQDSSKDICRIAVSDPNCATNFIVVVVGEFQYEQKGWYPHWSLSNRVDLATANKISSHQLAPCAAYYYMTATGIDGHVRGYTTKTVKYHTPYGKLYDAVQQGKTWKSYGPFIGDWSHDVAKLKELQEARDVACNETQNMKLVFNYGASGSSPDAAESDEPTHTPGKGSSSTITVLGKDDFNKRFAKGGIYKIVKSKKDATLTAKTTDVKTFYRLSDWFEFDGWIECKKNDTITADMMGLDKAQSSISWRTWNGNKCGLIGEKKPANAPAGLSQDPRDDFRTGTADWGFFSGVYNDVSKDGNNSGDWNELDPKTGKDIYNQVLNNPGNVYVTIPNVGYKEISALFNRGYATRYKCGNQEFDANAFGNNGDMDSQTDCTAVAWHFQNDILAWAKAKNRKSDANHNTNFYIAWNTGGYDAWKYGMPLHGAAEATLNDQLHPVGNRYQSIVAIAYQDFLNVNCNKRDFDAFVNQVSTDAVNAGIPENLTLRANVTTNTKYNGRANTGIITQELVDSLHWNGLPQIVPRMLGQNQITISYGSSGTDRYVNGLTPEQVTGTPDRSKVKVRVKAADGHLQYIPWVEYIRQMSPAYSNYWKHYDASTDPVYSKECPFDCTDDRASTNDTAKNNVMADKNNPTQDDAEHGRTGVLATDNTSNGSISDARGLSVNTANMVFFRNNEWNQFVVDLYTPKSGTNNAGDISYDGGPVSDGKNGPAKSTIITRDPDGTPWFAADASKTVLTHLQPMTGAYAGKDIFTNKPDETSVGFGQQLSIPTETTTTGINQTSVQLYGQINSFRIKSAWATENGKPLKFQMKWEYNANDHVSVPSTISFKGTGTTTGNIPGDVYREDTIATAVDGKCLGQQNTLNHTPDTTDLNHDNSGSGTNDNDDTTFDTNPLAGSGAPRGWFEINFVRATAE